MVGCSWECLIPKLMTDIGVWMLGNMFPKHHRYGSNLKSQQIITSFYDISVYFLAVPCVWLAKNDCFYFLLWDYMTQIRLKSHIAQ